MSAPWDTSFHRITILALISMNVQLIMAGVVMDARIFKDATSAPALSDLSWIERKRTAKIQMNACWPMVAARLTATIPMEAITARVTMALSYTIHSNVETLTNALEILTTVTRPLQAAKISKEDTSVLARVASNTNRETHTIVTSSLAQPSWSLWAHL